MELELVWIVGCCFLPAITCALLDNRPDLFYLLLIIGFIVAVCKEKEWMLTTEVQQPFEPFTIRTALEYWRDVVVEQIKKYDIMKLFD
jgi:hypothetical protein